MAYGDEGGVDKLLLSSRNVNANEAGPTYFFAPQFWIGMESIFTRLYFVQALSTAPKVPRFSYCLKHHFAPLPTIHYFFMVTMFKQEMIFLFLFSFLIQEKKFIYDKLSILKV